LVPEVSPSRERTIRWVDPSQFPEAARTLSGLEFLRAVTSGRLPPPPIAQLLGFRFVVLEPSHVEFDCEPEEFTYNPLGTVHGGIVTVLLDTAMGCAFQTTLPAGVTYTTLELKVNFVRPVTTRTGRVRADGRVIHPGTKVATSEARLTDAAGKLYAHSTCTLMVLPIPPA
jgi:uncharacterized protein (TIGR00369 family)